MGWFIAFLVLLGVPFGLELRRTRVDDKLRADTMSAGQFVKLAKGVTHYRLDGPTGGPVIVAIHGLTTPSYIWSAITPLLTRAGYCVLSYDLFGRGLSDRASGAQDETFFVTQLHGLLEALEIRTPVVLLGYSLGGMIAVDFAAKYPSRARAVVLLCPAGLGYVASTFEAFITRTPILGDWLMRLTFETRMRRALAEQSDGQVSGIQKAKAVELTRRGFCDAVLSAQRHMLTRDQSEAHRQLQKRGVPVGALWAELDTVIPLQAMGRLAQINREATQEMVELASHNLPHTHAQEVAQMVHDVITRSQRKRSEHAPEVDEI
ncbi:alpha/beta fold hydrolase [Nereida sp. MMG025]|uniref:alpha/beta fold hydrolase n=1 Tax=Nereida sp. MMG025 TaxID=2909981 RepID=UPI001F20667C|nr:alpha/beta hydrolase [Nereida sp. MMG025]MCF6444453.1 alpha/beta hydrolase [Nereida sp. MMG025]